MSDYSTEETVEPSDEATPMPPRPEPVEADGGEAGTDDWDD